MVMSRQAESRAQGASAMGDLGPLAWVLDETRKSIDGATKSLKRFAHDAEAARGVDLASVDASQLRMARQRLHQVAGALDMVGQAVPARMVRGMEGAVQQFVQHPEKCTESAARTLERAGFALLEYLQSQLSERPRSALGLFVHYKQVQEMAGADRVHPADLWTMPWHWADPATPTPLQRLHYEAQVRSRLDQRVLKFMRHEDLNAASELRVICLGLAQGESARQPAIFWKLSAGFFEALAKALVPIDVYAKRAASRILLQYGTLARGEQEVSERLAQDLLFFCALAQPGPGLQTPVLDAVRAAWALDRHAVQRYDESTFGLYDPAVLAQARRRVEAVKDNWSAIAGGDLGRMKACTDQFSLVAESLGLLHEKGKPLADALNRVARLTAQSGRPPSPGLAMETATAVLFLEASFTDFQPADATLAARLHQLAERLDGVCGGATAAPLEPWMEELYRSVSDRQTLGTVVGELRVTLGEVEQHLDQFFRNPAEPGVLTPVPALMGQMRGVLSVLGLDQAALAVARLRDTVVELLAGGPDAEQLDATGRFEMLGNSLGALGFQIDMLGYQPVLARQLFTYDARSGELRHVIGRQASQVTAPAGAAPEPQSADLPLDPVPAHWQPVEPAAGLPEELLSHDTLPGEFEQIARMAALDDKPALAEAAHRAAEAARSHDEKALSGALDALQAAVGSSASTPEPVADDALPDDADLLDIFLEEARDVVRAGRDAVEVLASAPGNLEQQMNLRRAFHTLKGSSRMVGLAEFGEAAWSMEQLLNAWLPEQKPVTPELRLLAAEALGGFDAWAQAIAARRDGGWSGAPFRVAADALRLQGQRVPLDLGLRDGPEMDVGEAVQASTRDDSEGLIVRDEAEDRTVSVRAGEAGLSGVGHALLADFDLPDLDLGALGQDAASEPASAPGLRLPDADAAPFVQAVEMLEFDLALDPGDGNGTAAPLAVEVIDLGAAAFADGDGPDWLESAELVEPPVVAAAPPAPMGDAQPVELAQDLSELEFVLAEEPAFAAPVADWPESSGQHTEDASGQQVAIQADIQAREVQPDEPATATEAEADGEAAVRDDELHRQIGGLRISTPLYNVYLNEADEWSRQLITELSEWALELDRPVPERAIARAHSLAGSSATVGFTALSELARAVEHALLHLHGQPHGTLAQARVLGDAADEIRRVLHQFAAGMLKAPSADLLHAVQALEPTDVGAALATEVVDIDPGTSAWLDLAQVLPAATLRAVAPQLPQREAVLPTRAIGDDIDVVDAVDPDLFPIFEEEAQELLPQLGTALRQWVAHPDDRGARGQLLRTLHTLKGSARLAGALRLGEMAHRTESAIEGIGTDHLGAADLEPLLDHLDELQAGFRRLQASDEGVEAPAPAALAATPLPEAEPAPGAAHAVAPAPVERGEVALPAALSLVSARAAASQAVRVRAQLLDRLMTQAGEVVTSRARLETEVGQLRGALGDLTGNLERLRLQLRDVELQAETQLQSRLALSRDTQQSFDPLEFDRFTRMQELTRMMAESVNDVATVQRTLQRAVEASEDDLAAQARQSRELQRDLLRTRMVEFDSVAERLYRVVRQASKESGKQVRLDIVGGAIEIDRGILERMAPAFEHLVRNCVVHGIESPDVRAASGKEASGLISVAVQQAGNDVSIEFGDDGAGLDLPRIRGRALELGLVTDGQVLSDAEVANLVFASGFSTATEVTELAGRGVGMDVVRTEVQSLGGRIETHTQDGKGARFRLVLPLTTAVTHVVMLRCGALSIGVPSNLVEIVQRVRVADLQQAYASGRYAFAGDDMPFFWSGALLQSSPHSSEAAARTAPVVILRSANQRVALHVDEVLGNQEVVVKALGPQLSRLPGLVAITALASGAVALIYNPVALAAMYGEQAQAMRVPAAALPASVARGGAAPMPAALHSGIPLVLVVDDSITVRRVTQRLLQREGYRVALAADGLQGLERLQAERPTVVLSDIEMPRMDGFDFVRNIRADDKLADLPVIMITSRIAEKHREHARELGVNHYLGKPYSEDQLLRLIRDYAQAGTAA